MSPANDLSVYQSANRKQNLESIVRLYPIYTLLYLTMGKLLTDRETLTPRCIFFSTDRSKAVVPVLVLLFVVLWFIIRRYLLYVTLCYFVIVFFSPFSIAITSLGEERANLSAFSSSSWCLGSAAVCDCGTYLFFKTIVRPMTTENKVMTPKTKSSLA